MEIILQKPLLAAPKRLQRMMMRLQNYNLTVVYKLGQEMYLADTLSRAYISSPDYATQNELEFIRAVEEIEMTQHLSINKERLRPFSWGGQIVETQFQYKSEHSTITGMNCLHKATYSSEGTESKSQLSRGQRC